MKAKKSAKMRKKRRSSKPKPVPIRLSGFLSIAKNDPAVAPANQTPASFVPDKSAGSMAEKRLMALIRAKEVITFQPGVQDKEYPYIVWSIFGAVPTNEIFVRVKSGKLSFVDCVASPLLAPGMANRLFGMDVDDSKAAGELSMAMWKRHKHQLIRKASSHA